MESALPLDKMNVEEKIKTMELIWDDLSANESLRSPDWHGNILKEREIKFNKGEEKILEWEEAKRELQNLENED